MGIIFFTFEVTNSIYVANNAKQKKAISLENKEICIYIIKYSLLIKSEFQLLSIIKSIKLM